MAPGFFLLTLSLCFNLILQNISPSRRRTDADGKMSMIVVALWGIWARHSTNKPCAQEGKQKPNAAIGLVQRTLSSQQQNCRACHGGDFANDPEMIYIYSHPPEVVDYLNLGKWHWHFIGVEGNPWRGLIIFKVKWINSLVE